MGMGFSSGGWSKKIWLDYVNVKLCLCLLTDLEEKPHLFPVLSLKHAQN